MKINIIVWSLFLVGIVVPHSVHAYIDPGSGSLILQVLIGGVVGIVVAIKLYWKKIIAFVSLKKTSNKDEEPI